MSFGSKSVTQPKEDPAVAVQRDRSLLDLAKLDEEENRRIKQLRSASRGVRAFRAMRSSSGSGSILPSSSGGGSTSSGGSGNSVGTPVGWSYSNWGAGVGG